MINRFNVRVYFILSNPQKDAVLVSDEIIAGGRYTKFPGGGLEFGEGPEDCARREAREELGQEITLIRHLYTTGFFQQSAFRPSDQVVAIYYEATLQDFPVFRVSSRAFDFPSAESQSLRWIKWNDLREDELSFATDRHAWAKFIAMSNEESGNEQ